MMLARAENDIIENPIINEEFKEEVIHVREVKPKKKANTGDEPTEHNHVSKNEVGINIVAELVQEWLPETIKRFNCGDSEICLAELTVEALNKIPPKYVYIKNEKDFANVKVIKEKYKSEVISTLVQLAIKSKSNPKYIRIS